MKVFCLLFVLGLFSVSPAAGSAGGLLQGIQALMSNDDSSAALDRWRHPHTRSASSRKEATSLLSSARASVPVKKVQPAKEERRNVSSWKSALVELKRLAETLVASDGDFSRSIGSLADDISAIRGPPQKLVRPLSRVSKQIRRVQNKKRAEARRHRQQCGGRLSILRKALSTATLKMEKLNSDSLAKRRSELKAALEEIDVQQKVLAVILQKLSEFEKIQPPPHSTMVARAAWRMKRERNFRDLIKDGGLTDLAVKVMRDHRQVHDARAIVREMVNNLEAEKKKLRRNFRLDSSKNRVQWAAAKKKTDQVNAAIGAKVSTCAKQSDADVRKLKILHGMWKIVCKWGRCRVEGQPPRSITHDEKSASQFKADLEKDRSESRASTRNAEETAAEKEAGEGDKFFGLKDETDWEKKTGFSRTTPVERAPKPHVAKPVGHEKQRCARLCAEKLPSGKISSFMSDCMEQCLTPKSNGRRNCPTITRAITCAKGTRLTSVLLRGCVIPVCKEDATGEPKRGKKKHTVFGPAINKEEHIKSSASFSDASFRVSETENSLKKQECELYRNMLDATKRAMGREQKELKTYSSALAAARKKASVILSHFYSREGELEKLTAKKARLDEKQRSQADRCLAIRKKKQALAKANEKRVAVIEKEMLLLKKMNKVTNSLVNVPAAPLAQRRRVLNDDEDEYEEESDGGEDISELEVGRPHKEASEILKWAAKLRQKLERERSLDLVSQKKTTAEHDRCQAKQEELVRQNNQLVRKIQDITQANAATKDERAKESDAQAVRLDILARGFGDKSGLGSASTVSAISRRLAGGVWRGIDAFPSVLDSYLGSVPGQQKMLKGLRERAAALNTAVTYCDAEVTYNAVANSQRSGREAFSKKAAECATKAAAAKEAIKIFKRSKQASSEELALLDQIASLARKLSESKGQRNSRKSHATQLKKKFSVAASVTEAISLLNAELRRPHAELTTVIELIKQLRKRLLAEQKTQQLQSEEAKAASLKCVHKKKSLLKSFINTRLPKRRATGTGAVRAPVAPPPVQTKEDIAELLLSAEEDS